MRLEFVDSGTTSVLLKGDALARQPSAALLWQSGFVPSSSTPLVSKIITDRAVAATEMEIAMRLSRVDPSQQYLLYPYAAYELPGDAVLLEQGIAFKRILGQKVDSVAPKMYLFVMQDGGASVYEHEKRDTMLTEAAAKRVLGDLLFGLLLLHGNQLSHGDIHVHNAVMKLDPPRAYWVDFGKLSAGEEKQRDVGAVGGVVKTIVRMTNAQDFKRAMSLSFSSYNKKGLQSIMASDEYDDIVPRLAHVPVHSMSTKGTPSPNNTTVVKGTPQGTPSPKAQVAPTPSTLLRTRMPARTPSPRSSKKVRVMSYKNE